MIIIKSIDFDKQTIKINKSKQFKNKLQLTSLCDLVGGRKRKREVQKEKRARLEAINEQYFI